MQRRSQAFAILIVEDESMIRIEAAAVIEEAGFKVYEASNADQAVRSLAERRDIGVLFTDVEMPGPMNGLDLARYVNTHFRRVKIIVTSGRRKPEPALLPDKALFLSKPYRLEHVTETLRQLA